MEDGKAAPDFYLPEGDRSLRVGESMRVRMLAGAIMVLLVVLPACLVGGNEREDCHVCGMWIDMYMKTRHVAVRKDGTRFTFCSIACTAKYLVEHGDGIERILAADYLSAELIDARTAFYLSGSDVFGVMTYTSRLAFSSKAKAEGFQKEHGGNIIDFEKALAELKDD